MPLRERAVGREPADARPRALRRRRAGRAARSRRRAAARARAGVSAVTSGVPQASAWNALFGITRLGLRRRAEDAERAAGARGAPPAAARTRSTSTHSTFAGRSREQRVELAAADDAERRSPARAGPRRGSSRAPCSGISLPTKSAWNVRRRLPARHEEPLLGADEADGDALARQPAERREGARVLRRCRRRRGRRARSASRSSSRGAARAGGEPGAKRPRSSTSVSWSDTSGLKTTGRPRAASRAAGRSRWPGIADDRRRRSRRGSPAPARSRACAAASARGRRRPERPLVPPALPDADVALDHVDAGPPQAGDHLRVPRVVALVRPEVEDAQASATAGSRPRAARRGAPRRPLLVVARDELADEPERDELDADDDEQHAEREQRPVADRLAGELEHGQVDEQRACRCAPSGEPEPAEEVQRPVPVAPHERDREQVEEAAQVPLHPVARAAVLARPVVDGQLRDAEAAVVREHGDEAVQLAVDPQAARRPRRGRP